MGEGTWGSLETWAASTRGPVPRYQEFLRVASLSAGVYVLGRGAVDGQSPHGEDEVYYVASGRARFRSGAEERPVGPGDVLFVPAGRPHRFLAVEEELVLLVVFAPPEGGETPPVPFDGTPSTVRTPPP
jgi:mannose-6-phosphate isomerase-like protein (cupin superfamily)